MTTPVQSSPDEIHAIPYNRTCATLRRDIALLQHRVASTAEPPPVDPISPEHDPLLDALSFYLIADSRVVSYAAVVYKPITHGDETFWIAGLSCVATDPEYQGRASVRARSVLPPVLSRRARPILGSLRVTRRSLDSMRGQGRGRWCPM
jgi:hypothetical protein